MEESRASLAAPQQDNRASHPADEYVLVPKAEGRGNPPGDEDSAYASLHSATSRVAIKRAFNAPVEPMEIDRATKASMELVPRRGADGFKTFQANSSAPLKRTHAAKSISSMDRRIDALEELVRSLRAGEVQRLVPDVQAPLSKWNQDTFAESEYDKESETSHNVFDREQSLEIRNINLDEFRTIKAKYEVTKGNVILCAKAERREVGVQISTEKETSECS